MTFSRKFFLAALTDILFLSAISANDGARARVREASRRASESILFSRKGAKGCQAVTGKASFSHENVSSSAKNLGVAETPLGMVSAPRRGSRAPRAAPPRDRSAFARVCPPPEAPGVDDTSARGYPRAHGEDRTSGHHGGDRTSGHHGDLVVHAGGGQVDSRRPPEKDHLDHDTCTAPERSRRSTRSS